MSYRTAIHDLLVTTAHAGTFDEAIYSVDRPSSLTAGTPQALKSCETNEIRGSFEIDDRYGREFRQQRAGWAWLLIMRFDTEVLLEAFEESLMRSPLTIARDSSDGRTEQVRLLLEEAAYEHPPRGGASNGTEVTYRFVAELCPQ